MDSKIEISEKLYTDDRIRVDEIIEFIENARLNVRKIKVEPFLMASVLYEKSEGMWDIYLYNYTRHKETSFAYLYLALVSILRRENIWFKTVNPIHLDEINNRILVDYFTDKVKINGAENFRQEYMQGLYLGFEIDLLLKKKKITPEEALKLFYDCDHLPEQAAYCAALRRNNGEEQAKLIIDAFWRAKLSEYLKTVERIDECIDKNAITEKDFFYIQKVHFPTLKPIDFDSKYDAFMRESGNLLSYDLAVSFAGEDRVIAKEISDRLTQRGYKVFYDEYEKSVLWGKDLYEYLTNIYSTKAKYCLIIISESYVKKAWSKLERKSAQSRAFSDENEYILPLRLDDAQVPGILPTTAYIDFRKETIIDIINLLVQKINDYGS